MFTSDREWREWVAVVKDFMSSQPSRPLMQLTGQRDGRPHLRVSLFGINFIGLLDSGASRSLIGGPGWKRLSSLGLKNHKDDNLKVATANGNKCDVLGKVEIPVELAGRVKLIEFLIVPSLVNSLILGIDFWESMSIVPDLKNKRWMFNEEVTSEVNVAAALVERAELAAEQEAKLKEFLTYWQAASANVKNGTDLVQHSIDTGNSKPIKQRYYPVSPAVQTIINQELDKMLKEGVVERSSSPWSSPVVLVRKSDGSHRFCVDFRKLNAVTKRDAYPLPYVRHILDKLRDARYLSSLDLKSAYWQVKVAAEDREKTAFTVPGRGLFHFVRMPFGLHNAPATWQRLIDSVLGPELEPKVFVYLDDIVVVTQEFQDHMETLNLVMKRLCDAGLTLNWDKAQICRPELRYLGYVIDRDGLHVDPDKVKAILDFPQPRTVRQVRRFLGLASWYRRFVPHFASASAPLSDLLKKNKKWSWTDDQEKAFRELKDVLVSAPVLTCPDFSRPFILQTDSSSIGLGAILSQVFEDGEKPIAYASRSLTKNERNFSVTEQECLAVLWAVEKFRPYLEGMEFTVITDHHSLTWLLNLKDPQGRLARWSLRLQQYAFNIQHRPGTQNAAADALSRANEQEAVGIIDVQFDNVEDWYASMIGKVQTNPASYPNWKVENNKKLFKRISERKEKILSDQPNPWKLVVPKRQRADLLLEYHDSPLSGHLGGFKTLRRMKEFYYWPGMAADVARYVARCSTCLQNKPLQQLPAGLMGNQKTVDEPWQLVSADLMGPLPLSSKQNRYILVVVDYFTKYSVLMPLRQASAKTVTKLIEENVILRFGAPQKLICDNGSQFASREFKDMLNSYGVTIWYTAAYHPQANPTERVNRVIKTMMASYVKDNHRSWDKELPKLGFALQTAVHEATGYTPAYLNFGRELKRNGKDYPTLGSEDHIPEANRGSRLDRLSKMSLLFDEVKDRLARAYERSSRIYNLRRRPTKFQQGDIVWKKEHVLSDASKNFSSKLAPKFTKCKIKRMISNLVAQLEGMDGRNLGHWHVEELKPQPPP